MLARAFLVSLLALLTAGSLPTAAAPPAPEPEVLRHIAWCDVVQEQGLVARTRPHLVEAWQADCEGRAPALRPGREMVVGLFSGERPTGGHAMEIVGVHSTGEALVVMAIETSPGPGCAVTQALTYPYDVVAVTRSPLPVVFAVEQAVTDCP